MKGLEALNRLVDFYNLPSRNPIAYMLEQENLNEYANIIKKELKALEIIKEKRVNVRFLISCKTLKEYNDVISDHLTKEEYDLLKEVLL